MASNPKIVILGAGPTGLGAALRCTDLGYENWELYDAGEVAGGLARSFVDEKGFTWDIGGHVIFSHYKYFDDAMDFAIQEWNDDIQRESWVFVRNTWVPYPFQNNIHRLPNDAKQECLNGLLDVHNKSFEGKAANFDEQFTRQMGDGIAGIFMRPYNFKVWAVPPNTMSTEWTGERVATVDLKRVCKNIIHDTDDAGWGPNAVFRFPQHGGTGAIWKSLSEKLPQDKQHIAPTNKVTEVDVSGKKLKFEDGREVAYDVLISTTQFDGLIRMLKNVPAGIDTSGWNDVADNMQYSATNVIGLGIKGTPPPHLKTMCWMYFPEDTSPFYRVTVFSNYAKSNAPDGCWSLMLEVSESAKYKPVNQETLMEDCIQGCINTTLLTKDDEIVSKWHKRFAYGYPTPFTGRNDLLEKVQPHLKANGIYSRGRFGGWRYEVANQDHSMMQGVEAVEEVLGKGEEITYPKPSVVNTPPFNTERRLGLLKK